MSRALKQNKISLTQQAALFEPHLQCFLPKIETQYPVCASALVNCHPQWPLVLALDTSPRPSMWNNMAFCWSPSLWYCFRNHGIYEKKRLFCSPPISPLGVKSAAVDKILEPNITPCGTPKTKQSCIVHAQHFQTDNAPYLCKDHKKINVRMLWTTKFLSEECKHEQW